MEATLSSRNRVTLPKRVRQYLNLKAGDRFKFFLQPDGNVVILPKPLSGPKARTIPAWGNAPGVDADIE